MPNSLAKQDFDLVATFPAPHEVSAVGAPASGVHSRSRFVFDPATGALIVSPELDLKIRRALGREVSRIKRRLFVSRLLLKFNYFALKARLSIACRLHKFSKSFTKG